MKSIYDEMLVDIAEILLRRFKGPGWWTDSRRHTPNSATSDECLDVDVGDIVYEYDSDDCLVEECKVICEGDGVPFVAKVFLSKGERYGLLEPVLKGVYFKTIGELVDSDEYKQDEEYHGERLAACHSIREKSCLDNTK